MRRVVDKFSSLSEVNREAERRKEWRKFKETGWMVEEGKRVRGRKVEKSRKSDKLT